MSGVKKPSISEYVSAWTIGVIYIGAICLKLCFDKVVNEIRMPYNN